MLSNLAHAHIHAHTTEDTYKYTTRSWHLPCPQYAHTQSYTNWKVMKAIHKLHGIYTGLEQWDVVYI